MAQELTPEEQTQTIHEEIDALLDQVMDSEQDTSIEKLKKLCTREDGYGLIVADYLAKLLEHDDTSSRRRGWILSALAEVNQPVSTKVIAQHLEREESERVRMWGAVALAKMNPSGVEKKLEQVATDESVRVRATALRLLVERNPGGEHLKKLEALLTSDQFDDRWAALRVLRDEFGSSLPEPVERRLLPYMVQRLEDNDEWRDVRQQAALALGSVTHHKERAIQALGNTLKSHQPQTIRRNCVAALANLKDHNTQETLLYALSDESPQIRTIAVEALKNMLKTTGAIELIINDLVRRRTTSDDKKAEEKIQDGYIEALRYLNDKQAAEIISRHLLHPDPKVVDFAVEALTLLGGETAIRTLQAQRAQMLKTYTSMLEKADERIMSQFETMMKQARLAFKLSLIMHSTIFVVGVIIMLAGLVVAVNTGDLKQIKLWVGLGGSAVGLGAVANMFYRDPFKNIGHSVNNLVKINVVFLGYVRQINQIDATFKQVFFSAVNFSVEQMKETVGEIEDAVGNTLERVKIHLPE